MRDFHPGEGEYAEVERAIQEALGIDEPLTDPIHEIDAPESELVVPTEDQDGLWSGDYEAGEVWAVLEGRGTLTVNGESRSIERSGPELLISSGKSERGTLALETSDGLSCHAVCFSPGLA